MARRATAWFLNHAKKSNSNRCCIKASEKNNRPRETTAAQVEQITHQR